MLLESVGDEKQPSFATVLKRFNEWDTANDRTRFFRTWLDDADEIMKGLAGSGA